MNFSSSNGLSRSGQHVKLPMLVLEIKDRVCPEDKVLGWILVERKETTRRDPQNGTIRKASIRLLYQRIIAKSVPQINDKEMFCGSYSCKADAVSLTSLSTSKEEGMPVFLDLPGLEGQRIGTYLMNEVVQWVRQWPDATVNSITLLAHQADDDNKARRNRFYEQFGLVFDYADSEHRAGRSRPMKAIALTTVETWRKNIVEHQVFDYLSEILCGQEKIAKELKSCRQKYLQLKGLYDELKVQREKAVARPLLWAWKQMWGRIVIATIVFLGLFVSIAWVVGGKL